MKNFLLIPFIFAMALGTASAQTSFFDDFESYADGALIAQSSTVWGTWSGPNGGGADDANVSTEQAYSGTKSLKLYSASSSGGPDDIILPFGDKFTDGVFDLEMYMYVVAGTGAYFNFQAEETPGVTWALEVNFNPSGTVSFAGLSGAFPVGQWFKLGMSINLTLNYWELFVNDVSQGAWANGVNAVAAMNLYPVYSGGSSQYYIDDIGFLHDEFQLPTLDATMASLNLRENTLAGTEVILQGKVKNTGSDPITSMDISWTDGTNTYTDNLTGLNIASLAEYDFTHSSTLTTTDGATDITVTVSNPNGAGVDENPGNDALNRTITGHVPAPGKKVVVEEGTGTWCGWCPRGTIFMDQMYADYGDYFIPIAVHNGDPMTVTEYDDGLGLTAFPTMKIMREETFGFGVIGDIESRFFQRITQAPPATLQSAGVFNETTRDLDIISQADFSQNVSGNHRLAVVLVEDNVTGTSTSYAQANYYAGGANGPMGGYESLPNPVPANQMVYDHVGRILVGGFQGAAGSVPASVSSGEKATYQFATVNIPANIKTEDLLAVTLLLGTDNSILNAQSQTFQELLDNEIVSTREVFRNDYAEVYPNPSSGNASLRLTLDQPSNVSLRIFSATGAEVAFRDYGQLSGDLVFPLEASNLPAGVYQVHLTLDKHLITKKIVIQR
jgi:hypothetical protein